MNLRMQIMILIQHRKILMPKRKNSMKRNKGLHQKMKLKMKMSCKLCWIKIDNIKD